MADRTTDDTRELPQDPHAHRRITYELNASEPEEARTMGSGLDPGVEGEGSVAEGHPRNEPVDDATEVVAWCERCDEERRFVRSTVDASAREERSASPNVAAAIEGEEAWVCTVCGNAIRDPMAEGAYDFEYSNVGHHVHQFADEHETARESATQGVESRRSLPESGTLVNPAEGERRRPPEREGA